MRRPLRRLVPRFPVSPRANRRSKPARRSPRRALRDLPLWQRLVFTATLAPALLVGGASAAFYLRLHRESEMASIARLPLLATPHTGQRILVIAPHCDDETLGAGSLIAEARRNGVPVTIAFLTNGDGFHAAASRTLHEVNLTPSDYVRFAEKRQVEATEALGELGVTPRNIQFLGYPDRGLKPMWEDCWDAKNLYRSYYTGHTRSPYARTFTPRTPYCGAALEADLERLLETVRPTDIFVTHPSDDHPDHAAAPAFAQAAVALCVQKGDAWAQKVRMRYYLVHRGDWPLPQGNRPDRPLTPPAGMTAIDTHWIAFPTTNADKEAKTRALERYVSQMNVCRRFLSSFVRTNELFGTLPEPTIPTDFVHLPALALDAAGDDVTRYAAPAADITGISLSEETGVTASDSSPTSLVSDTKTAGDRETRLRIRLTTRGRVSPRVQYVVRLIAARPASADGLRKSGDLSRSVALNVPMQLSNSPFALEATVPLSEINVARNGLKRGKRSQTRLWVSAETRLGGRLLVDNLGYRTFLVGPAAVVPSTEAQAASSPRQTSRTTTAARRGSSADTR